MDLKSLKVGRNYKVKNNKKVVVAKLLAITPTSKEKNPAIQYEFETVRTPTQNGGFKFSVRGGASIVEEVPFEIKPGTLVKVVKGVHKSKLTQVYSVVSVSNNKAVITTDQGRTEIPINFDSLRHIGDCDPEPCFFVGCRNGVSHVMDGKPCCTTHFRINDETGNEPLVPDKPKEVPSVSVLKPKSRFDAMLKGIAKAPVAARGTSEVPSEGKVVRESGPVPKVAESSTSHLDDRIKELELELERQRDKYARLFAEKKRIEEGYNLAVTTLASYGPTDKEGAKLPTAKREGGESKTNLPTRNEEGVTKELPTAKQEGEDRRPLATKPEAPLTPTPSPTSNLPSSEPIEVTVSAPSVNGSGGATKVVSRLAKKIAETMKRRSEGTPPSSPDPEMVNISGDKGPVLVPHAIVRARAGTGKTTTLMVGVQRIMGIETTLVPSPQQAVVWDHMERLKGKVCTIAATAFNTSITDELAKRVPAGVVAKGINSLGFTAVRNRFRGVVVNAYKVDNLVARRLGFQTKRECERDKTAGVVMAAVADLVGYCKQNLVSGDDPEEVMKLVGHYGVETPAGREKEVVDMVPGILQTCKEVTRDNEVDFTDQYWLPIVLNLPVQQFDLLLVDEAQDLNRCQQELVKRMGKNLLFCGDDRQAIYGFAGADSESLDRLGRDLAGSVVLPLTVTRRCSKAVVEEARKIVPDFEAHPDAPEGSVTEAKYPGKRKKKGQPEYKVKWEDSYAPQVQDGDMILCRTNGPLVSQCFQFLKRGRRATIKGRKIGEGLVKTIRDLKATDVPDLIGKLTGWYTIETEKENNKKIPSDVRLMNLTDKYECIIAFTEGINSLTEVEQKISSVFTDGAQEGIKLSSIHKAKGLEANRVFFINCEVGPCPHPLAKTAWSQGQEMNLKYVGITRAITDLIWVI